MPLADTFTANVQLKGIPDKAVGKRGSLGTSHHMVIDWASAAGTAAEICAFFGPFTYKDRKQGGSHVRAALDVGFLFIVLLLWIVGASNGLGYVIDEPPEILGVAQISTKSSNQALQPTILVL